MTDTSTEDEADAIPYVTFSGPAVDRLERRELTQEDLAWLAEQQYPERPIYLPDGGAMVAVPMPERKAFIAGYTDCARSVVDAWDEWKWADTLDALRSFLLGAEGEEREQSAFAEQDAAIREARWADDTWTDLCHADEQMERLTREQNEVLAVLEPFARHADAVSLSDALGHIERAHLMAARDLVARLRRERDAGP